MAPAQTEDRGLDLKSIAINIASILFIILPIVAYLYQENARQLCGGVLAAFAIAFLLPPVGWKRPHPYSDMPNNYPYPRKND
mmetsp:Transcript_11035/g.13294  ORF Transcript_11035/g.13294 Transcript_11035/m.13294 type:complete len:82 (-) Transcript_11035:598-843(-)